MGIALDRWQEDLWYLALGIREDGSLACDVMGVTLSIARQAGKTFGTMVGLVALCLRRPDTLAVWSSHHDRTSAETLEKIAGIVERPEIRPRMRARHPVVMADDSRGVHFANGSRILFGARSAGFGRGFSGVDIQVYDEAQNLKEGALTDMLAAMNVSDIGLAIFMGTPPRPQEVALGVDEAFKRRRNRALDKKNQRPFKGVYVEFSPAADEVELDLDSDLFWERLREANPSFGYRVGRSAIERLVENMSPDDVRREVLGMWDRSDTASVVQHDVWAGLVSEPGELGAPSAWGLNAPRDGFYWLAACWSLPGDRAHVEVAIGTQSEVELLDFVGRHANRRVPIKHDSTGAAKAVGEKLKGVGYNASPYNAVEAGAGNALWLSLAEQGRLSHAGQRELDMAVRGAQRRDRPSGGWMMVPRTSSVDIGPAIAMSASVYAAMTIRRLAGSRAVSRGGGRRRAERDSA